MKPILGICQGGLGDTILCWPALEAVSRIHGAPVHLACRKAFLDPWVGADRQAAGFSTDSAVFSTLFSGRPAPMLTRTLSRYAWVIVFSKSRDVAHALTGLGHDVVCVESRPDPSRRVHVAEAIIMGLIAARALPESTDPARSVKAFAAAFQQHAKPLTGPVVIHPGSGSPRKCLDVRFWQHVVRQLVNHGLDVRVILGPAEQEVAHAFDQTKGVEVTASDLGMVVDVLARARAFAGHDSGITHLAAMTGLPTVAVFGPSDPVRWHPVGRVVTVIRPELTCLPCFETGKENCHEPRCLTDTRVDQVVGAVLRQDSHPVAFNLNP